MDSRPSRIALITGGAAGIGAAVARGLVRAGHRVACADHDAGGLERLTSELGTDNFVSIMCDLSNPADCERAVVSTISTFGDIQCVFNNVGIGVSTIREDAEENHPTIDELSGDLWDRFYSINLRAAVLITRLALPKMKAAGWGRIINVTTSFRTMLRVLPYGATKAALEATSAVWAKELSDTGITVNVLVPGGPTDTALIAAGSGWPRDKLLRPEIMCPPAVWLLSDEADEVSGMRITACEWRSDLPDKEAVAISSRQIGWPELALPARSWQKT